MLPKCCYYRLLHYCCHQTTAAMDYWITTVTKVLLLQFNVAEVLLLQFTASLPSLKYLNYRFTSDSVVLQVLQVLAHDADRSLSRSPHACLLNADMNARCWKAEVRALNWRAEMERNLPRTSIRAEWLLMPLSHTASRSTVPLSRTALNTDTGLHNKDHVLFRLNISSDWLTAIIFLCLQENIYMFTEQSTSTLLCLV